MLLPSERADRARHLSSQREDGPQEHPTDSSSANALVDCQPSEPEHREGIGPRPSSAPRGLCTTKRWTGSKGAA